MTALLRVCNEHVASRKLKWRHYQPFSAMREQVSSVSECAKATISPKINDRHYSAGRNRTSPEGMSLPCLLERTLVFNRQPDQVLANPRNIGSITETDYG